MEITKNYIFVFENGMFLRIAVGQQRVTAWTVQPPRGVSITKSRGKIKIEEAFDLIEAEGARCFYNNKELNSQDVVRKIKVQVIEKVIVRTDRRVHMRASKKLKEVMGEILANAIEKRQKDARSGKSSAEVADLLKQEQKRSDDVVSNILGIAAATRDQRAEGREQKVEDRKVEDRKVEDQKINDDPEKAPENAEIPKILEENDNPGVD